MHRKGVLQGTVAVAGAVALSYALYRTIVSPKATKDDGRHGRGDISLDVLTESPRSSARKKLTGECSCQRRHHPHDDDPADEHAPDKNFTFVLSWGEQRSVYVTNLERVEIGSLLTAWHEEETQKERTRMSLWEPICTAGDLNDDDSTKNQGSGGSGGGDREESPLKRYRKAQPDAFVDAVTEGVPTALRGQVWQMALDVDTIKASFSPQWYAELQQKPSPSAAVIERDVGRTMIHHTLFKGGIGRGKLQRLLNAYTTHRADVGYVQGMNYVAAVFLLVCEDEEDAFWCFFSLMEKRNLVALYEVGLKVVTEEMSQLQIKVKDQLPKLNTQLTGMDLDAAVYSSSYFFTLLSYNLPFPTLLRVWDCFFIFGGNFVVGENSIQRSLLQEIVTRILSHLALSLPCENSQVTLQRLRSLKVTEDHMASILKPIAEAHVQK